MTIGAADAGGMSPRHAQVVVRFAQVVSGAYLVLGICGLLITGFNHFSNVTGVSFLVFTINPLTNVIHVCVGLIGIPMALSPRTARIFALILGGLGLPFAIAGFFLDGTLDDFFARNPPLIWLHLLTSVAALVVGLWPVRAPAPALAHGEAAAQPELELR
ncbi:MAG TPA: DUF4383 domain-containing protein [Miltoncostaeaceae bacterium]|nr:DUF4383 domain-containing protein [Miltoncostaeaceae bacterium]